MTPILALGLKVALVFFAAAGFLHIAGAIYRRARDRWTRHIFLTRQVTLEYVAALAEKHCKNCLATGVLNRRTGVGKNAASYPILCSCASRAFMKLHEADTKMLGNFRIWKLGRGPRRGAIARARPGVAATRAA